MAENEKKSTNTKKIVILIAVVVIMVVIGLIIAGVSGDKKEDPDTTEQGVTLSFLSDDMKTVPVPAAENFAGGTGSEENPYKIADAGQLALFAKKAAESEDDTFRKAHYILIDDIIINDISEFEDWDKKAPEYGWTPINDFTGSFDGDGYKIIGMFIASDRNDPSASYGLFGKVRNAEIKNVTMERSLIYLYNESGNVGSVAGSAYESVIENCDHRGVISVKKAVAGGICGTIENSELSGCDNSGTVTSEGSNYIGGIAGSISGGEIKNCRNSGTVKGLDSDNAGGIAGLINDTACRSADREKTQYVGFEPQHEFSISGLANSGIVSVKSEGKAGGIAAVLNIDRTECTVDNCSSSGLIAVSKDENWGSGGMFATVNTSSAGASEKDIPEDAAGKLVIKNCNVKNKLKDLNKADAYNVLTGAFISVIEADAESDIKIEDCRSEVRAEKNILSSGFIGSINLRGNSRINLNGLDNRTEIISSATYMGGIAGEIKADERDKSDTVCVHIENCINSADIESSEENRECTAGGIAGKCSSSADGAFLVEKCINEGSIRILPPGNAGGIIGDLSVFGDAASAGTVIDNEKRDGEEEEEPEEPEEPEIPEEPENPEKPEDEEGATDRYVSSGSTVGISQGDNKIKNNKTYDDNEDTSVMNKD